MEQPIFKPELVHRMTERITCSYFGCKKQLTLIESLAGNVCTAHMGKKKLIQKHIFKNYNACTVLQ
jgi:hypothetical protein